MGSIKLFSDKLITDSMPLPDKFILRPLESTDYEKGFLSALSDLTTVGPMNQAEYLDRFHYLKNHSHEYYTVVIEDQTLKKIAAAGTM